MQLGQHDRKYNHANTHANSVVRHMPLISRLLHRMVVMARLNLAHYFSFSSPTPFQFFTDGITNKLLGCYVGATMKDVVLVRIYGNKTELFVDRENEVKSFRVLHENRCAPHLYCTFNNGLCYEFLQGTALEPEHIRSMPMFR